jgi:4-diphosphocytidyl-2-C-methyl-D-erythritol kinase
VKIRAPAKLNLSLRIIGKRADGYHLLDSVMVPISLYDEIIIVRESGKRGAKTNPAAKLIVVCKHPLVPSGPRNLVYRAAALLMQMSAANGRHRIEIRKRIPVGAGLGGGSSDAAATLIGMNRLLALDLSVSKLRRIAAPLGADVPFFIDARPARARGIGEQLTPIREFPRLWAIVLYPGFPVSTSSVYRKFTLTLTKPTANTSINSLLRSADGLRKLLVNDLESVTFKRYPELGLLKENLIREGAVAALMSGSGSSVFGIFTSRQSAEKAFRRLRKTGGPQAFLVRILD